MVARAAAIDVNDAEELFRPYWTRQSSINTFVDGGACRLGDSEFWLFYIVSLQYSFYPSMRMNFCNEGGPHTIRTTIVFEYFQWIFQHIHLEDLLQLGTVYFVEFMWIHLSWLEA